MDAECSNKRCKSFLDANNLWSQTEALQHSKGDRQTESAGGRARERELEIRSISTKYKKNTNACTHTDTYTGRELGSQTDNQSGSQVINTDSHSVNKPFFSQGGRGGGQCLSWMLLVVTWIRHPCILVAWEPDKSCKLMFYLLCR